MPEKETRDWRTPEFVLVVIMLIALVLLVWGVLWFPVVPESITIPPEDLLDYRKSILGVVITAFAAWVGAGAAYFFGRESLKEASSSILAMRESSPRERLRQTPVRYIPPQPLDWTVKTRDKLKDVQAALEANPEYRFITVVNNYGRLKRVVEEDAFWRFVKAQMVSDENKGKTAEAAHEAVMEMTVQNVLDARELKRFMDRYVSARLDMSVGAVCESMQNEGLLLAIVLDESRKPTHSFTTADVRRVLLQVA